MGMNLLQSKLTWEIIYTSPLGLLCTFYKNENTDMYICLTAAEC